VPVEPVPAESRCQRNVEDAEAAYEHRLVSKSQSHVTQPVTDRSAPLLRHDTPKEELGAYAAAHVGGTSHTMKPEVVLLQDMPVTS
jgi:hypothetical protein